MATAQQRKAQLQGGQQLQLQVPDDQTTAAPPVVADAQPRMVGSVHRVLWDVLAGVYDQIGFTTAVESEVFKKLVVARLIEPASKLRSLEILESLGLDKVPSYATVKRHLARSAEAGWRDAICAAAYDFAAADGPVTVCLYDATTLHIESDHPDAFRRPGFSKDRQIDPQIVLGLLVDRSGFPLELHTHPGNTAEATTILPVLDSFKSRPGIEDIVVVADAGMLSYANCVALEAAGYQFIIASRVGKMPKGLQAHLETADHHHMTNGWTASIQEKLRADSSKTWRTVYQFTTKRFNKDRRTLDQQIAKAQDIADGKRSMAKARFVSVKGKDLGINQADIDRARALQGIKGYVTSASQDILSDAEVVAHYHALFEVEASFRLTKHDLEARPMFHRTQDMIDAHLNIVFCALAIARYLQTTTGYSLRRIRDILRPLTDGILELNGQQITIPAAMTPEATELINVLGLQID
jgi:transposase